LVTEVEDGWLCGTGSMILRLHHSEYHAGYLNCFLSLGLLRQYFESFSIGAIMDSLSSSTLLALPMIVPPVEEQARIVSFIKHESAILDALISEAERGIELLQERRTALISAAVTGKIDVRGLVETENV
jgi:type I restriction enzyme S subunit